MNCPNCKTPILQALKLCSTCGYVFDAQIWEKLSFYFDLKGHLERLLSVETAFKTGLNDVFGRVKKYEQALSSELEILGKAIERKEEKIEKGTASESSTQKTAAISKTTEPILEKPVLKPKSSDKSETFRMELHLGQKWLMIAGLVTMIFGVGYFLKYSFERGWIGPAGRVALAYLWGIAFLVTGNLFQKKKFKMFGLYLIGGGIATLYFSTFAAFQIYHLISQIPAFFIMVLITVLAGFLSVIHEAKWLAVVGMIGGFLTPILLRTGQDNQIALMSYMTVLNIGLLGIAFYKKWDLLNGLGFFFTYLVYAGWFSQYYNPEKFWPSVIFVNIFYLIYSVIPFAYQFLHGRGQKIQGFAVITPNSFIAFGYSYFMIKEYFSLEWVSVITIGYSMVFLLMALFLHKRGMREKDIFAILLGKSWLFLIITVPIIFSKHWITIFWAAQAFALLLMGTRMARKSLIRGAYLLLLVSIGKFLVHDYYLVFRVDVYAGFMTNGFSYLMVERMFTSISLLLIGYVFASMASKAEINMIGSFYNVKDSVIWFSLLAILLFIILNVEVAGFFRQYLPAARFAAQSVLWTLFSVALIIKGFRDKNYTLRKVALGLFLITLIKVFMFDMAHISTPYRILSFIVLGLVLVGTSYLYYRFKDRILSPVLEGD